MGPFKVTPRCPNGWAKLQATALQATAIDFANSLPGEQEKGPELIVSDVSVFLCDET
jgi:hypothetical protein